jgi:ABC-type molybdenum transport system ATPase subunit/photorepair protein PhrA
MDILNNGVLVQDPKGARITVRKGNHNWIVGLRSNYGGSGKTTVSTICSSRNPRQTQEMVNFYKMKMSGTNAAGGQKTNTRGGQPDET